MSGNNDDEEQVFEALLEYLRQVRGFDFTGYKRSTLKRRVNRRMQTQNIETYGDYLDYLQVHPEEFVTLFNTILINVTGFFRDASAWQYLKKEVIPRILSEKAPTEPIRVWSAGCASGQEAYTLAIILVEVLGEEQCRQRVKIYATDLDEEALTQARSASYSAKEVQALSPEQQERFLECVKNQYVFRPDIRRLVIFGRHDLVQDAPMSRLDLLVCRNVLMYFNSEAQAQILYRFQFALNNCGVLFLGKAEMLLTQSNLFTPINLRCRMFSKTIQANFRNRRLGQLEKNNQVLDNQLYLQELAFDNFPLAQLVVDRSGNLAMVNKLARLMFSISLQDIGRPLQDLAISYRPVELRSRIEIVYKERRPSLIADVVHNLVDGNVQYLDVQVVPLNDKYNDTVGVSITFTDVTRYHNLQAELQRFNQELETANEELQSGNEELETTNEELQSTNEELETTNEELQSTNEELETINEELQSSNEELQSINEELNQRTEELNHTNALLNSILTSIQAAVVVIERQFNILSWNNEAENMWGLRSEEVVGQSFFALDIGLPVVHLQEVICSCLMGNDNQEVVVSATNRRGRAIQCRVTCNPLIGPEQERRGVIMLMDETHS